MKKKIKQKTRKSVSKRFRITKTGKVLRLHSGNRHLRRKKSRKQKRNLKRPALVKGRLAIKIKKLLGIRK